MIFRGILLIVNEMNTAFKLFVLLGILIIGLVGCENNKSTLPVNNTEMQVWADTIIYDVLISNPDSLLEWESAKVKNVRHKKLVDDLFEMIYTGKKKAYHYYTNKPLSVADIKELEADAKFGRDKVGKLQFTETWLFDKNAQEIKKQIHNILLAYEIYGESNTLRGYKAAFYLKDF